MKKRLLFFLACLVCHSIFGQNDMTNFTEDSQSITKTGISLPQLITTNINRSNLQFGVNLSQGFERPNLSLNYKKFISDEKKQLTISSGANLGHTFSFNDNDNLGLYNINDLSLYFNADLKLFNKKDFFIEFATQNLLGKSGGISDFDQIYSSNSLTFAIGKGRIDIVSDGAAALAVTEKLTEYGILNRELTEEEYYLLVERISELKNRRKFVNRSFPLTENEEIQDLLATFGVIDKEQDITTLIADAYQYEPLYERTTGSQFKLAVKGSYFRSDSPFIDFSNKEISGTLSYHIHKSINSKWQYNKGISGYVVAIDSEVTGFNNGDNLKKMGIGIDNDFHYFLDNRIRMGLISTVGYNLVHKAIAFDPIGKTFFDNDGFFLYLRTELDFQISRTMSSSFGINLNITPEYTFTGLSMGLKF